MEENNELNAWINDTGESSTTPVLPNTTTIQDTQPKTVTKLDEKIMQQAQAFNDKLFNSVKVVDPIEEAYKKDQRDILNTYKDNHEEAQKHLDLAKAYYDYSIIARRKKNLEDTNVVNPYDQIVDMNNEETTNDLIKEENYKKSVDESWGNVGKRAGSSVVSAGGKILGYTEKGLGTVLGALTLSKGIEQRFHKAGDIILEKTEDLVKNIDYRADTDRFWVEKYNKESTEIAKSSDGFIDATYKGFKHGISHPFTAMADSAGEMLTLILTPELKISKFAGTLAGEAKVVDGIAQKYIYKKGVEDPVVDNIAKGVFYLGTKGVTKTAQLAENAAAKGWLLGYTHTNEAAEEYKQITGKELDTGTKLIYFAVDSVISGADFDLLKLGTKDVLKSAMFTGKKDVLFKQLNVMASKSPTLVKGIALTGIAATEGVKGFTKISASAAGEYTQEFLQEWHEHNLKTNGENFATLTDEALKEIAVNAGGAAAGAGSLHASGKAPSVAVKSVLGTASVAKAAAEHTIKKYQMTSAAKIVDNDHLSVKDNHNRVAVDTLRKANKVNRDMYNDIMKGVSIDELKTKYKDKQDIITDIVKSVKTTKADPETVNDLKTRMANSITPPMKSVEEVKSLTTELVNKLDNFSIEDAQGKKVKEIVSPDTKNLLAHILNKAGLNKQGEKVDINNLLESEVNEESLSIIKEAISTYNNDLSSLTNVEDTAYSTLDSLDALSTKYDVPAVKTMIDKIVNEPLTKEESEMFKLTTATALDNAVFTNNQAIVQLNSLGRPIKLGKVSTKPVKINGVKVHNNTANADIILNLQKETKDKSKELSHNLSLDKLIALKEAVDNTLITERNEEQLKKTKEVIGKALDTKVKAYNTLFGKKQESLTEENIDFGDTNVDPEIFKGENSLQEDPNPTKVGMLKTTYANMVTKPVKDIPNSSLFKETILAHAPETENKLVLETNNPVQKVEEVFKNELGLEIDTTDKEKVNKIYKALVDAKESADKVENITSRKDQFFGDLYEKIASIDSKLGEEIINKFEEVPRLYSKLVGKNDIDTTVNKDNIKSTLQRKQDTLSDESRELIASYIDSLITNHPSVLYHPMVDPIVTAFTGTTKYKDDAEFKATVVKHINRQYQALLSNTNKTNVLDKATLDAVKGQFKALKVLSNHLQDNADFKYSIPTKQELNLIDSNLRLLDITARSTGVKLNDIISSIKETGKALKREWANYGKVSEEDRGTSMEYSVFNEKPSKKDLSEIYKKLEQAGLIC